jgi:hypothetical protein
MGRDEYTIALFQPNLQRPDNVPLEFGFQRQPPHEFSFRPSRLCLEVLPERESGTPLRYFLQDFQFVSSSDRNWPVARFDCPRLPDGTSRLRLWFQPFQSGGAQPASQTVPIADQHLNGPNSALTREIRIGEQTVQVRAWGNQQEQSITVHVSGAAPALLRELLVDLWSVDDGGNPVERLDTPVRRTFAEPVLLEAAAADSRELFCEHTFHVADRFGDAPLHFSVDAASAIFPPENHVEFTVRND